MSSSFSGFDWSLHFKWEQIPIEQKMSRTDPTQSIRYTLMGRVHFSKYLYWAFTSVARRVQGLPCWEQNATVFTWQWQTLHVIFWIHWGLYPKREYCSLNIVRIAIIYCCACHLFFVFVFSLTQHSECLRNCFRVFWLPPSFRWKLKKWSR